MPDEIRPTFFGARLIALNKKDGGIRPIAVGCTMRRLTSKLASCRVTHKLADYLSPLQLGVGVSGGVEAAVHATRCYISEMPNDHGVLKIDFANAFNSIRRDCIIESVESMSPDLLHYVHSSYGESSILFYSGGMVSSEEGVQQGDPLGPILFCLAVQPLLRQLQTELCIGYLDDFTLGDSLAQLGLKF